MTDFKKSSSRLKSCINIDTTKMACTSWVIQKYSYSGTAWKGEKVYAQLNALYTKVCQLKSRLINQQNNNLRKWLWFFNKCCDWKEMKQLYSSPPLHMCHVSAATVRQLQYCQEPSLKRTIWHEIPTWLATQAEICENSAVSTTCQAVKDFVPI